VDVETLMQSNSSVQLASFNREKILVELQALLKVALNLESTAALRPEARFREDLKSDSLAMVDIIIAVEEGFGIKMRSDLNFFEEVQTVGDAVELIYKRLNDGAEGRS